MRAPATGSKVPNSLYMPSDSFLMFASRRARWRRRRSSRSSPAERSLTWSRTVWANTSAGSFSAATSNSASSTGVCAEASAIARACCGVIAPSASAPAVPGRSASRSANCTSRLAPPRDCFKSPRSTSAACASPRQRASSVTLSAFTAARRASQRPTTRKHSSTRSPPSARNPTTSTSNNPRRCPVVGSPAAGSPVTGSPVTVLPATGSPVTAMSATAQASTAAAVGVGSEKRFRSVIGGSPRERVAVGFGSAGPTSRLGKPDPRCGRGQ